MKRAVRATFALGVLTACADAPTAPTREITLCSHGTTWMAYQNEGEDWKRSKAGIDGFYFPATERLGLARFGDPSFALLEIEFLTAEQAMARYAPVLNAVLRPREVALASNDRKVCDRWHVQPPVRGVS